MGEWYYIGHYGQLGPLSKDQIDELIQGGVIVRETYVWRAGMTDWVRADSTPELGPTFGAMQPVAPPPPPLSHTVPNPVPPSYGTDYIPPVHPVVHQQSYPRFNVVKSDRSRTLGGVLQLLIPGVGRMYMGYAAIGVLQLVLTLCAGVGWVWSVIDGIIILGGGVKMDGYGRQMND